MSIQNAHTIDSHSSKTFTKSRYPEHELVNQYIKQGLKFIGVGLINTAIDFLTLNAFIFAFGLGREGITFVIFKSIAFLVAAANSFILNKHWVFEEKSLTSGRRFRAQIYKFMSVSAFSLVINIVISYTAFTIGHRINPEISTQLMANISALIGTGAVFISNFLGYKLLVFKK